MGYEFEISPECEFFLFHTDEDGEATSVTHDTGGYLDLGPLDPVSKNISEPTSPY